MRRGNPLIGTAIVCALVFTAILFALTSRDRSPSAPHSPPTHIDSSALNATVDAPPTTSPPPDPTTLEAPLTASPTDAAPPEAGPGISLVHPVTRRTAPPFDVRVGAPGMYPHVLRRPSPGGIVSLPRVEVNLYTGESHVTYIVQGGVEIEGTMFGIWQDINLLEEHLVGDPVEVGLVEVQPLSLALTNPEGEPVVDASVRLQRATVGLIALEARTDANGIATFDPIPAGEYVASIKASGLLSRQVSLLHELTPRDRDPGAWGVTLERGRAVYGRVVNERGMGIPDAFVTAYVERWGEPRVLPIESFDKIDAVPAFGVAIADPDGYFSISGLPSGVTYLGAQGATGMPALSLPIDLREVPEAGPITLVLEPGADVEVVVVGPDGEVIPGAKVSWKDGPSGLTSSSMTDARGVAIFEDVSRDARFVASARTWQSARVELPLKDVDGVHRLQLVLEPAGVKRRFDLRISHHPDLQLVDVSFISEKTRTRCPGERLDEDDWRIEGCPAGAGELVVQTREHGVVRSSGVFEDLQSISLPRPSKVSVIVSPWEGKAPDTHALSWSLSEPARSGLVELVPLDRRRSKMHWEGELFPGEYELLLTLPSGKSHTLALRVAEREARVTWLLSKPQRHEFFVVDHRDHPIANARVEVWVDGARVLEELSRGRSPVSVEAESLAGARVFMMDDVRAGGATLTRADLDAPRHVLTMSQEVMSSIGRPGEITSAEQLATILGAPLVEDDGRYRIDARRGTPAASAGIPRGAAFVAARRGEQGVEVLYRQHARGAVEEAFIFSDGGE